ncbi:flagellar motor switch protein FliG [Spirochaetota bacterium]
MKSVFQMTGTERAAALLVAMGPDIASDILKHFNEEDIDKITLHIARIDKLDPAEKEDLVGEFIIDLRKMKNNVSGGENKARELLIEAFGEDKASIILKKIESRELDKRFDFIKDVSAELLVTFLQDEHPQAITVTLTFLPPKKAASILKLLPRDLAKDIAIRMAKMDKILPEAVLEIANGLKYRYIEYIKGEGDDKPPGGVNALIDILSFMSFDEERRLISHFEESTPSISQEIYHRIFNFGNVVSLSNTEARILIDEISDDNLIAIALKGAGDDVRFKFIRNMSRNRATDVLNEMDNIGAVQLMKIEKARNDIVDIMRVLHDNGVISLTSGRGEDLYVE